MVAKRVENMPSTESEEQNVEKTRIDRRLIPSKLSYFFMECYGGAIVPYLVVFLASTGLNVKEAGFITGVRLIASSISAPLWGYLADRTGKRKLIFLIICLGTAITIFPMPWVAWAFRLPSTPTAIPTSAGRNQSINATTAIYSSSEISQNRASFSSTLFYVMLSLVFVSNIFSNPINGVIDSYVMNVVKSNPRKADYGKQRMFGAFGFGLSNFLAGFVSDHYHEASLSNYTAIFYVFLPSILLLMPSGYVLASQTKIEIDPDEAKASKAKYLISTFRQFDNVLFMLSTFIIGVVNAVVIGYIFQLMADQMQATTTIMGLSNLIASLIEIIVFPFTDKILRLCGGAIGGIELAIFSYFVRLMMVSYITNPWLVLPTQILNCLSFALFWASAVEYTQQIARKEIYVTMFSILNSVYFNVAGLVGYLGGGVVYDHFGGKTLFLATGYLSGAWVLVMLGYYQGYKRMRKHETTTDDVNHNGNIDHVEQNAHVEENNDKCTSL